MLICVQSVLTWSFEPSSTVSSDTDMNNFWRIIVDFAAKIKYTQWQWSTLLHTDIGQRYSCQTNKKETRTTTTPQPFTALFPRPPGLAGARRELRTLWCNRRLTEADTLTIRLGATPSGLTGAHLHHRPFFTGLPSAQPTVSKHWRQKRKLETTHFWYRHREEDQDSASHSPTNVR